MTPNESTMGDEAGAELAEGGAGRLPALAYPFPVSLLIFAFLESVYFVVRYGGFWADNDTAYITRGIRTMGQTGRLLPTSGVIYPQGFGYTAVSSFLVAITGSDVAILQQIIYPLVSAFVAVPAWVLYRELTGNRCAASIATLILLSQPEFLFVVLRGSHERMLRTLLLLSLWLLVRSFRFSSRPHPFAVHVLLFYLVVDAAITTNLLFALSFIVAVTSALMLGLTVGRARRELSGRSATATRRLLFVAATATVLGFASVVYEYSPATTSVAALGTLGQQVIALLLTTAANPNDPYRAVASGWVSLPVYFLVSISDYLLLLVSAALWLWQAARLLWEPACAKGLPSSRWLLWLLYGAFAAQGVLAIVADRSGQTFGNLQERAFPSFAVLAAPTIGLALCNWHPRRWSLIASSGAFALFSILALLKATNDPLVSNKWLFYRAPELQAVRWGDLHVADSTLWLGPDERIRSAYFVVHGESPNHNDWDIYQPKPGTRLFLVSDTIRLQETRFGTALPPLVDANRVYDNGGAQFYRLQPRTPYQH